MWLVGHSCDHRDIFAFVTSHIVALHCHGWWLASLFRPSSSFLASSLQHRGLGRENKNPPESSKKCFASCYFSSLCRMMYVPSLTLKVCFHNRLIKGWVLRVHVSRILWHHKNFGNLSWSNGNLRPLVTMDFSVSAVPSTIHFFDHLLVQFVPKKPEWKQQ